MPFDQSFSWDSLPDINEVRDALRKQAQLRAELKVARLELEQYQAWLSQRKPRDSSVKLVGIDEQTRLKLDTLLQHVAKLEGDLDHVDADVKFNDYRREACKIMSYGGRT
jgi:hypothetical protein